MRRISRVIKDKLLLTRSLTTPSTLQTIKPIISLTKTNSIKHFSSKSINLQQHQQQLKKLPSSTSTEEDEIVEEEIEELEEEPTQIILEVKPTPITLRPYQLDCEEYCLKSFREDSEVQYSRIGVSAPTGSGKTAIFTSLIRRLAPLIHPELDSLATRVLVLVGSIELARQAASTVSRTWPELTVEIEQGSKHVASGLADVTIATYQTLSRSENARLQKFDSNLYKAVIVDEAHHAAAKSYLDILAHFDSRINGPLPESVFDEQTIITRPIIHKDDMIPSSGKVELLPVEKPRMAQFDQDGNVFVPIIGFTATFGRADGFSLGKIFEKIVWHGEWLEMIRGKWLSELRFTTVKLDKLDLSSVATTDTGDFQAKALAAAVDKQEVRELAISAWFEKAQNCKSTLVFAVNVAHILSLTKGFRDLGIDARFVHAGTHQKSRLETLRAFKNQEFPVLVNCGILTEGADFPAIDCVLLARPTKSQNLFLQMIGRGLRLHPGKESCLIIDLVGSSVDGLICTPTLFGIDPDSAIENKSTKDLTALKELASEQEEVQRIRQAELDRMAATQAGARDRAVEYTDYATVFDLLSDASTTEEKPQLPHSFSRLSWVGCGDGIYVLEIPGKGHLRIAPTGEFPPKFELHLHKRAFPGGAFISPVYLGRHADLATLIRKADADFFNNPSLSKGIDLTKRANWRRTEASQSQKVIIANKGFDKKLLQDFIVDDDGTLIKNFTPLKILEQGLPLWLDGVWLGKKQEVDIQLLTKGEASDIICRMMHGGVGFLRKQKRDAERKLKKLQRVKSSK